MYTVANGEVVVVKSWPADEAQEVSRFRLGDHANPQSLFLRGDKPVVFSQVYEPAEQPVQSNHRGRYDDYQPTFYGTRVSVVDITDRPTDRGSTAMFGSGWNVYASEDGCSTSHR